jgi:GT2 family glycosyltransferase
MELKTKEMITNKPIVSIIIVNYNTKDLIDQCLNSIYKSNPLNSFEIIVSDNASIDNSVEMISLKYSDVIILKNEKNLGFSKANNLGVEIAKGEFILFLNSDTIVYENSIDLLIEFLRKNKHITAVGPKLLNFDKTIQRSWFDFPNPLKTFFNLTGVSFFIIKFKNSNVLKLLFNKSKLPSFMLNSIDEERIIDYLTLACLLIRKNELLQIGKLDENIFFYHEDCELGYKLNSNSMKTVYFPKAEIVHLGGSSSQKNIIFSFSNYYKNLNYVFKKYEKKSTYVFFKTLLIIAFLIRSFLWLFGLYRSINMFSVYSNNPTKSDEYKTKPIDVLKTYIKVIFSIVKK